MLPLSETSNNESQLCSMSADQKAGCLPSCQMALLWRSEGTRTAVMILWSWAADVQVYRQILLGNSQNLKSLVLTSGVSGEPLKCWRDWSWPMVLANCLLSEQFLNGLCSNYWSVPWSTWSWPLKFGQDYCDTSQDPIPAAYGWR